MLLHFTADVCATPQKTKVKQRFFTQEQNGLLQSWLKEPRDLLTLLGNDALEGLKLHHNLLQLVMQLAKKLGRNGHTQQP